MDRGLAKDIVHYFLCEVHELRILSHELPYRLHSWLVPTHSGPGSLLLLLSFCGPVHHLCTVGPL
ncbi:MAG: hypothetical protein ACK55I_48480, partial [bacterium]